MKQFNFILPLIMLAVSINAQSYTLDCHKNELVDKAGNCITCPGTDELFTGLTITKANGLRQKIYTPFKVKYYNDGEYVRINDAYGNTAGLIVDAIATYDTLPTLNAFLGGCMESPTNGAFYLAADSTLTNTGSLQNIAGWSFPVDSGDVYEVELIGQATVSDSSSAVLVGLKSTGSATLKGNYWLNPTSTTIATGNITAITSSYSTSNGGYTPTISATPSNAVHTINFKGILRAAAAGTVYVGWGKETSATMVVKAGTTFKYQKINR